MSKFKDLYTEVLKSEGFREKLLQDPAETLRKKGIRPSPEVLAAVCGIIEDVEKLQQELKATSGEMDECVS
jgi:hypothetical protein